MKNLVVCKEDLQSPEEELQSPEEELQSPAEELQSPAEELPSPEEVTVGQRSRKTYIKKILHYLHGFNIENIKMCWTQQKSFERIDSIGREPSRTMILMIPRLVNE